jgi:hypothetical protein
MAPFSILTQPHTELAECRLVLETSKEFNTEEKESINEGIGKMFLFTSIQENANH